MVILPHYNFFRRKLFVIWPPAPKFVQFRRNGNTWWRNCRKQVSSRTTFSSHSVSQFCKIKKCETFTYTNERCFSDLSFFRWLTALPLIDVKLTSKEAKQASFMTLVYHNLVYMVFHKLVMVKESLITKEFAVKLAAAKTDTQLDRLVTEIIEKQFPSPTKKCWKIPTLDQMEIEVTHLASYWNDNRVITL